MALVVKNPPANAGDIRDARLIPGSGRSPGGGHGNPFQDSSLENPHGQRSLAGFSPWGFEESDTTEQLKQMYTVHTQKLLSSVAQSCPTLGNSMNHSTPGLPVHYQLPEFTQTLVHRVSDAIQPSHPGSSPSPPVPNPSQHQTLFQ